ncbi:MAG TPA: preprotein translocase subunit SecG [Chthoniobacterales bacterium]|jgi:preprotein translocase subunit SecG
MSILITVLIGLWMIVASLMMLVILMQRPKSEGLGAAFGGAVTENLFGAQTTNVLVKFTAWLAGIFFAITFLLSVLYAHRSMGGSSLSRELKKTAPATQAPVASPSPATSPGGVTSKEINVPGPGSTAGVTTKQITVGESGSPVQTAPAVNVSVTPAVGGNPAAAQKASPAQAASASPKL